MKHPLIRLVFFVVCTGACFCIVQGQLRQERARRLSKGGRLVTKEIPFFPARKTAGEIASATITTAPADFVKGLRLHFKFNAEAIRQAGQAGTWKVVVLDFAGNELWDFDSKSESELDEFWSIQFVASGVDVKVFSEVPNSVLKLTCDERIEYSEPIQEKSIVGDDNTIEITQATDPNYIRWGHSVARLTFVTDDDKAVSTCTGFLIGADLFLTNEHCPRSIQEQRSAIVEFDYDSESARTRIYRLKTRLERNEALDFAIYKLNRPLTDRSFLKLANDDQNLTNQKPLIIIQHPAGLPKRLAAFQCDVKTLATGVQPETDFGHECDTQGGSSGSPIQNANGLVVGIHHYGFNMALEPALRINQGVKMGAILSYLEKQNKTLYKLLTNPQQTGGPQ